MQTFPDWFVFEGGPMAGGVQVGNAVPVHLGSAESAIGACRFHLAFNCPL